MGKIITFHHVCPFRKEVSHPRCWNFNQERGLPIRRKISVLWMFSFFFWKKKKNILLCPCKEAVTRSCKINRIHHWCSVGTEKSQPEGPSFQWETRLAELPNEWWTRGLGVFWNHWTPMIDSFSHLPMTVRYGMVQYSIISVGDVTEVDVYSQWRVLYKSTWNSE